MQPAHLPGKVLGLLLTTARELVEHHLVLDLRGDLLGVDDRIGVDRDGVDAALDEELAELRIDARELAADGHGLAVLVGGHGRRRRPG